MSLAKGGGFRFLSSMSRSLLPPLWSLAAGILIVSSASPARGQARVTGLEASELPPELKGRILLEELNCVACHDAPALANDSRRSPRLSGIGSRVHPDYLRAILTDPYGTKPGTTKPDLLASLDDSERAEVVEALTHYLVSLDGGKRFTPRPPDAVAAARGEELFHSVGCVACHSPRNPEGGEFLEERSVPLGELSDKYSFDSLLAFLKAPHLTRPSGRMPNLGLSGPEAEQITHYLLRETRVPGHLHFTLTRGRVWEGLDSDEVERERAGQVDDFSLERFGKLPHQSAIEYEGFLHADSAGEYTFFAEFNGGALWINGNLIFAGEPSNRRGPKKIQATYPLKKGWNAIELTYFHTGREPRFLFEMREPEGKRGTIPSEKLASSIPRVPTFEPLEPDPALVSAGREHFRRLDCARCHDDLEGSSDRTFPGLGALDSSRGCLSNDAPDTPRFALSSEQLDAIRAALPPIETRELTAEHRIDKTLTALNCIACHQRDGLGGIDPQRDPYFTGTREELGNQGRIPPPLTHVGAKLTPEWLSKVLLHGGRQRHYLATRMPQYGEDQVGHLIELLGEVDTLEDLSLPRVENIRESKNAGYEMMGTSGFSCIACHDFNGQESGGAGAMDLVGVTDRVQKNWFHLYLRAPYRFHPTVIMPSYWPGGQALRDDWMEGDTDRQIEALWDYLSDGDRAKAPVGLSRQSLELRVADETLICRGRGSSAGYRGIGVGYPERISLAFDSEQMSLRTLWKGEFANINHGRFSPRGSDRIEFPPGIPFHRLPSMDDDWPYKGKTDHGFPQDLGYRYRGYHLDEERRPLFRYEYGDVAVTDFFEDQLTEEGAPFFRRTLTFTAPSAPEPFHFRVAAGEEISGEGGQWKIDRLTLRLEPGREPLVREGEPVELLLPIALSEGETVITLEYQW